MAKQPQVLGSRNFTGSPTDWEVRLVSGWVPAELLGFGQRATLISGFPYDPASMVHDVSIRNGQVDFPDKVTPDPNKRPQDGLPADGSVGQGTDDGTEGEAQGDGEGEGEGEGQGEGQGLEDIIDKRIKLRVPPMIEENNKLISEAMSAQGNDLQAQITKLGKKVALVSRGNNEGVSGQGVTVKIEIVKHGMPELPRDGLYHHQFHKLVRMVAAGQHAYLPGPPGSGKSKAGEQVAEALGYLFGSISLGPTTPESRLWGGKDANGIFHEPKFVELARFAMDNPDLGAVMLLDELDNGHPGIIATLNSAMANSFFTAPNNDHVSWGNNFVIIGSANTYGTGPTAQFSGRNRLDAATLDRFGYLPWDTDLGMESVLVRAHLDADDDQRGIAIDWLDAWQAARANAQREGLQVFITMRGAINGAKLIAAGFDIYEAMDIVLLNKLPEDQAKKVSPL